MRESKVHGARRKLLATPFTMTAILDYEPLIREKVELAVQKNKREAKCGRANILMWWTFLATDIVGQLSFGAPLGVLEGEKVCALPRSFQYY